MTRWRPRSVAAGRGLPPPRRRAPQKLQAGTEVDEILPEVFAIVREVGAAPVDMRHFDVQLMADGLHEGTIAEMATGEGKTLSPRSRGLNGLTGRGVHIVTVNDYLARRDAQWMGPIDHQLGLSVAVIQH